ncbi:hypothetical protein AQS8620_00237 [Aquimixticola soesokkakensis]|uniref:TIGR00341 family protein n=1 Tax=Aquimixticola soesokkakensis TaxID=1519096 RepID=A0A1Y5RDP4_9RHOB|nr:TIGR00341 family protein [Aquimixticola soesokkakensis]SLN14687.1 hypothetical protein AQS8620_00237 [Aquimixticola soesokkakensis]
MPDRLIQLVVRKDDSQTICDCLGDLHAQDWWRTDCVGDLDRQVFYIALHKADAQATIDAISEAMEDRENWRLYSLATEANLPEIVDEEEVERLAQQETSATREEIYGDIRDGASLTTDYLLMTALATCVAAIGLNTGQVAVVIGAMVIAPLLGPILAFAFGTTLGNLALLKVSARSLLAGLGVSVAVGTLLGQIYPAGSNAMDSGMMDYSGVLGLHTVILPLASGAAAALMVAGNKQSGLVGVMVAAALLPPLAGFGLLLGSGNFTMGLRALASVIANIVAINLAAQVVFYVKGIRPRRWNSADHATSVRTSLMVSAALVALVAAALWGFGHPQIFGL